MKSFSYLFNLIPILIGTFLLGQTNHLNIKILQNNKEIHPIDQNIYQLKKEEFTLQFEGININSFLIGITQDEDVYLSAIGEANLEVEWFHNTGMAEDLFNKNKEMFISNEAPSYWYFDSKNDHRFDKNPTGNLSNWQASRTVKYLYNLSTEKKIAVKNNLKPIYMFFYTAEYINDDYENPNINIIRCIELQFN